MKQALIGLRGHSRSLVLAGVALLVALLCGCASTSPDIQLNPATRMQTKTFAGTLEMETAVPLAQNDKDFIDRLNQAQARCERSAQEIGLSVNKAKMLNVTIATIGIVAGSIIVPALAAKATIAKSTVAAWGGVAGAANAAQFAIGDAGRSPQDRAKTQKAFYDRVSAHIDTLSKTTLDQKEQFLWKLNWICANAEDDTGNLGAEPKKPEVTTTTDTKPGGISTTTTIVK